jgi:hypothetical protein
MVKLVGSLVLSVGLLTPVATTLYAQDRHDQVAREHKWDEGENQYWHQYLKERHVKDHEWAKSKKKEQADYWKWRDAHR